MNKATTDHGATPLLMASWKGHNEVVRALLNKPEIDVNLGQLTNGITPLMAAAQQGRTEAVKLLLRCPKIDITKKTVKDNDGGFLDGTALNYAIVYGNADIVESIELRAQGHLIESDLTC